MEQWGHDETDHDDVALLDQVDNEAWAAMPVRDGHLDLVTDYAHGDAFIECDPARPDPSFTPLTS